MAGRIFTVLVVLVLLASMPVIGVATLMVKFISYELLIISPAVIAVYLYAKSKIFRRVVRMIVVAVGNMTNTFIKYF